MFFKEIIITASVLFSAALYSQDSSAIYFQLYVNTINGNPCQALKYLDKAISIHPVATYYQERATIDRIFGNYFERIKDLKKAISLIPKHGQNTALSDAYYELAGAEALIGYLRKSNQIYKRAERELTKAKLVYVFDTLSPKWVPEARLNKVDRNNNHHRYHGDIIRNRDSIAMYKKALHPILPDTMSWGDYIFLGSANFHLYHFKAALKNYDQAVRLYPDTSAVYRARGFYKLFRGDKVGARVDAKKFIALTGVKPPLWLYQDCDY
jgi:tetratricopeptide (TPR) repeat protein